MMTTIFTAVKNNDATDLRIPLVFLEDDADVDKWIKIVENFMSGLLPNSSGEYGGKPKGKTLSQFDLKTLYGLRPKDINCMAGIVESKEQ